MGRGVLGSSTSTACWSESRLCGQTGHGAKSWSCHLLTAWPWQILTSATPQSGVDNSSYLRGHHEAHVS